jgi:hypothetical protein
MRRSSARSYKSVTDPGELRAALARPDFYPGQPERVTVRETHISWVFLAGNRAYKLKKPVVLPFVDYHTPQRRRKLCREEVRPAGRSLRCDAVRDHDGVRGGGRESTRQLLVCLANAPHSLPWSNWGEQSELLAATRRLQC